MTKQFYKFVSNSLCLQFAIRYCHHQKKLLYRFLNLDFVKNVSKHPPQKKKWRGEILIILTWKVSRPIKGHIIFIFKQCVCQKICWHLIIPPPIHPRLLWWGRFKLCLRPGYLGVVRMLLLSECCCCQNVVVRMLLLSECMMETCMLLAGVSVHEYWWFQKKPLGWDWGL